MTARCLVELTRVDDDMFDSASVPRIADVNLAVCGLNHSGVAELTLSLAFQIANRCPRRTVCRYRETQHAASAPAGVAGSERIVDQQMTTILEGHGFDPRVGIGQVRGFQWRPRPTIVGRDAGGDHTLFRAAENLQSPIRVGQKGGLNRVEFTRIVNRPDSGPRPARLPINQRYRLKMDSPAIVFGGGSAQQRRAVGQQNGFASYGPINALG
jgi:hypothetical protein